MRPATAALGSSRRRMSSEFGHCLSSRHCRIYLARGVKVLRRNPAVATRWTKGVGVVFPEWGVSTDVTGGGSFFSSTAVAYSLHYRSAMGRILTTASSRLRATTRRWRW